RAVECIGGLRYPKDPWEHHNARVDCYRRRTRLYRPLVRPFELRGPDPAGRSRRGVGPHHLFTFSCPLLRLLFDFLRCLGLASRACFDFLIIYIGPILLVGLCSPLIMRIVRLAKAQNITSIADFIAARYGKAQTVAATVALIAIIGTIPYIALQLKAVSSS